MKLAILTSNEIRHKYLANTLSECVDDALVICEHHESNPPNEQKNQVLSPIDEHFNLRTLTERKFFSGNDSFKTGNILDLMYKEASLEHSYETVKEFNPDLMLVFGSSIIKEPLLSLKPNRFINLHLGLSPYYRGSGTNFWPFVNKELEYVGSTILHLDPGIDTGDIITHVTPNFQVGDTVHTVGCKVIQESVKVLKKILLMVEQGKELKRVKQWNVSNSKYYKNKDFNEKILNTYKENLKNSLIQNYVLSTKKSLKLISLDNESSR